jgi:hypothetical protein
MSIGFNAWLILLYLPWMRRCRLRHMSAARCVFRKQKCSTGMSQTHGGDTCMNETNRLLWQRAGVC